MKETKYKGLYRFDLKIWHHGVRNNTAELKMPPFTSVRRSWSRIVTQAHQVCSVFNSTSKIYNLGRLDWRWDGGWPCELLLTWACCLWPETDFTMNYRRELTKPRCLPETQASGWSLERGGGPHSRALVQRKEGFLQWRRWQTAWPALRSSRSSHDEWSCSQVVLLRVCLLHEGTGRM